MEYTLTEELPLKTLVKLPHFQGPHISAFVELLKVCPELNQGGGYIKKKNLLFILTIVHPQIIFKLTIYSIPVLSVGIKSTHTHIKASH